MIGYSLGIECSTQSAKTVVLDLSSREIIHIDSINYDTAFPEYETEGGVLPSSSPDIRHTSPLMILETLDLSFEKLRKSGIDLSRIKAMKVDGMQHCSVYTNALFGDQLNVLDSGTSLKEQLSNCFSRRTSPIWEDRSTKEQAESLNRALENKGGVINLTGNKAELRFPAAQILKWAMQNPKKYENTTNIFLLSAFITSLLCGKITPVDTGDGWGTNLNNLDINNPGWSSDVTSVIDNTLPKNNISSVILSKIGKIDHYDAVAGTISSYFVQKYGVNEETVILTGTGDNPATLLGCGGKAVISLGSSYTVNGIMKKIQPSPDKEYNVFGYTKGTAMALSVITNGGKVHEYFYKTYLHSAGADRIDWDLYIKTAGSPLLTENENILLPYLINESVPVRKAGVIRDGFDNNDSQKNIRALILSQVLSLRAHAKHLGEIDALCIVGGGAGNELMMQWIADVFNAKTYQIDHFASAAPLGCAISGAVAALQISYSEAVQDFVKIDKDSIHNPIPVNRERMSNLIQKYIDLEKRGDFA